MVFRRIRRLAFLNVVSRKSEGHSERTPGNAERPLPDARRTIPGAPRGNKNALKHGRYTVDAIARWREIAELLRAMKAFARDHR
jgi:hypothetical protein